MVRDAGAAPAPAVWKTAVLAVTPMTRKWWLRPVSRRTPLVFSEVLIYLSYTASRPSARYRAAVYRLSADCSAFELRRNALRGSAQLNPRSAFRIAAGAAM